MIINEFSIPPLKKMCIASPVIPYSKGPSKSVGVDEKKKDISFSKKKEPFVKVPSSCIKKAIKKVIK